MVLEVSFGLYDSNSAFERSVNNVFKNFLRADTVTIYELITISVKIPP